jgi:hypothetical protein
MNRVAHRVRVHLAPVTDPEGPSEAELAAIEAEWPLIEAEIAVVDAESALAAAPGSEVAWRAHRRATRRVLAVVARMASSTETPREVA